MGNIRFRNDVWFIDDNDEIKVGEVIELQQSSGAWEKVKVGRDSQSIFHAEPAGEPFNESMVVRRLSEDS